MGIIKVYVHETLCYTHIYITQLFGADKPAFLYLHVTGEDPDLS